MEHRFKKSNAEVKTIKAIQFGVISPEFLRNISVTQQMEFSGKEISRGINHDMCYDPATGQPNLGAINDPRMGGSGGDQEHPGYVGHIELIKPVYHIGFLKIVIDVLRCVSYYTSELIVNRADYADKKGRRNLKEITKLSKTIKKCPITQKKLPIYTKEGTKISIDFGNENGKSIISPSEVYSILEKISDEDAQILAFNTKYTRPEWLLITTLCVPPPHVRPSVFMSSSQKCDDDLTTKLNEIVKVNIALTNAIEKSNQEQVTTNEHFISQLESLLQYNVNTFIDNQHPGQPPSLQRSGKPLKTLRERLSGKDGRVRGNLMGKRVDNSARTVITADPNLSLDQVGVPKTIAMNLTIPEMVTDFNKDHLLNLVKNGPNIHPGAKFIIKTGGIKLDLKFAKITELKNGWIVERHLCDGDAVIFNRQPSLHKMSMMGHKAKILDGLTFRLNLAYTGAYNADFDGDEMNLHVPQNLTARSEVENLMMVDKLIVNPQSNKPIIGIIQDSLLASCKMTRRDIFIKKDRLMNMIMLIDGWNHNIPKPAVVKNGVEYWTGKQVLSLILPESLNVNNVKNPMNPHDKGICIKLGKIISGSVDKSVIGKSQGGLIHILINDFGSGTTKVFINQVQKLSNFWIKQHGFTVGVGDAVASKETTRQVDNILEATKNRVKEIIKNENTEGKDPRIIEEMINSELNAAVSEAGKKAEESLNFNNNFKATVSAGSKGSSINISQIMACIAGDQYVSLKNGLSIPISQICNNEFCIPNTDKNSIVNIDVQSYVENDVGFSNANVCIERSQERECIKITLIDGNELICTPDHKILSDQNWKEASDLKIGDKLKVSLLGVIKDTLIVDDLKSSWNFENFSISTIENRNKTLAISRILGLLITDRYESEKFLSSVEDVEQVQDDLNLLGFKYYTFIPKLTKGLGIPTFLKYVNLPLSITREFLAAYWGCDGISPDNNEDTPTLKKILPLSSISCKDGKWSMVNYDELESDMRLIKRMMNRFDISVQTSIQLLDEDADYVDGITCKFVIKFSTINDAYNFSDKIGVRYNSSESKRWTIWKSFQNYKIFCKKNSTNEMSFNEYCDHTDVSILSMPKKTLRNCPSSMHIEIVNIEKINEKIKVYDLTVPKGNSFIASNIVVHNCVGQQNVEGRRINYGFKHRTLPHYQRNDMGQESRGFVENNYLKGLTPQEFFFHAQSGREGLIDTAKAYGPKCLLQLQSCISRDINKYSPREIGPPRQG